MKLVNPNLCLDISIDENEVNELVIENPAVFSDFVRELLLQVDGTEGDFVLSEEGKHVFRSTFSESGGAVEPPQRNRKDTIPG